MVYSLTDKLLYDLIDVEKNILRINRGDIPTKALLELKQTALIDELFYFAKKLNIRITFGEAKQIAVGKTIESSNPGLKLIYNYRSLIDFMKQNPQETSMNILTHMNKLLGNGILDIWECGMIRNSPTEVKNTFDFFSPSLKSGPEAFISEKTSRIVNAVKVLRYMTINKPFVGLNDATALAAFSMEIMKMVDNNEALFSPIKLLDEIDFEASLIREIEFILEEVINFTGQKSREVLQRIERENYDDSIRTKSKFLNLNERQLAALRYLEHNLKISRKQYMRLFNVSTMTAFRDMNQLVDQKIISVEGKGRGTYYKLER